MDGPRILPAREGYDLWSATYDTMGNWLLALEEPEIDRAIGGVRGALALDVGTGTGRHAVRLAEAGARVVGTELSLGMLERARAKTGAHGVRFVVHDATTPLPFADGRFDVVLSALVLEHVPDPRAFFAELARVARPGGRTVVSAMHPAMFERGVSARFRDEAGAEVRPRSHPATLGDYLAAVEGAGLRVVDRVERAPDAELAARFPRAAAYVGYPALLVLTLSR